MRYSCVLFMLMAVLTAAQTNTWTVLTTGQTGGARTKPALVYSPDSNRFLFMLGGANDSSAYSELMYNDRIGKWINFFPDDTLYGIWGDSTGQTRALGRMGQPVFSSYYFIFKNISYSGRTFLRPNLHNGRQSVAFQQYAYNPDEKKVYFYTFNMTFTYNTLTRRWDTIQTVPTPDPSSKGQLRWGCMAYDPVHQEMVLSGGGGADARFGGVGTWVYKPASRTWEKLNLPAEPPFRAYAAMATDYSSNKILFFGGDHLDYLLNDTWVYDCATRTWEKKAPSKNPAPRAGHALVYLPKSGKLVLMGGYEYTNCTGYGCAIYRARPVFDMWVYDMAANEWKLIKSFGSSETVPLYSPSDHLNAAADTSDRILVYGSNDRFFAMQCDPTTVDEPGTHSLGVIADTATHRTDPWLPAYFETGVASPDTAASETFLRDLAPNTWTLVAPPRKPASNHDWGTSVYDPDHDKILLFSGGHSAHCGNEVDQYDVPTNRWAISWEPEWALEYTYDAGLPFLFSFSGRPMVTHSYDNYCYDTISQRMIYIKPHYTFFYNPLTLAWDSVIPNPAAFTTDYHHISINATRHGPLAWVLRSGTSQYDLYLLDADSLRWRLLPRTGDALPSSYGDNGGGAYDSDQDCFFMFNGSSAADPAVCRYDFSTGVSTRLLPSNNASARTSYFREAVYLTGFRGILIGAEIDSHTLFFDCVSGEWRFLSLAKTGVTYTANSRGSGYMVDSRRNLVWNLEDNPVSLMALKLTSDAFLPSENHPVAAFAPELATCPNPFNPSIRISSSLPDKTPRIIEIYDASGRRVAVSNRDFTWNADSHASGVYLVRLQAKGKTLVKKIALTK